MNEPDQKVSEQLECVATELKEKIEKITGEEMFFTLLVYSKREDATLNFATNCHKQEAANSLEVLLEGLRE